MAQDLVHNVKVGLELFPGAAITSFVAGTAIDTQFYESILFAIIVGDFTSFSASNSLLFKVQESDTTTDGDFADVAAGDYLGAYREGVVGWDRLCDAATDDEKAYAIGVRANTKRYKRVLPVETGTVSVVMAMAVVLGHNRHPPV